jgi:hypothetical protein
VLYERMSESSFAFLRGSAAVMALDLADTRFSVSMMVDRRILLRPTAGARSNDVRFSGRCSPETSGRSGPSAARDIGQPCMAHGDWLCGGERAG